MKHVFLAICILMLFVSQAFASDFSVKASSTYTIKDVQMYVRNMTGTNPQSYAGTGLSYGPLYTVQHGTSWVADLGSVCGVATANTSSSAVTAGAPQYAGGIGVCPMNILGLQLGAFYDPEQNRLTWGIGLSITGLANQLLK